MGAFDLSLPLRRVGPFCNEIPAAGREGGEGGREGREGREGGEGRGEGGREGEEGRERVGREGGKGMTLTVNICNTSRIKH